MIVEAVERFVAEGHYMIVETETVRKSVFGVVYKSVVVLKSVGSFVTLNLKVGIFENPNLVFENFEILNLVLDSSGTPNLMI